MNSRPGVTATTDMAVLPGVLGCRPLRRTVQVRLGPIPRYRGTVARWHTHLRGLATAIHEISGLGLGRLAFKIFNDSVCGILNGSLPHVENQVV
jgi:hypothetical protein